MAEYIHTFTVGRMNKDLDERLVPNGEYRDALNLDLANSDASDVGALQNVVGNIQLRGNSTTGGSWTQSYIDALTNPVCIGTYRDDINERIYWFIASDPDPISGVSISAIAEYDQTKNAVKPILVDNANILNFSSEYLITGINIIDKFLFWTDDQTEPKKINIEKFRTGSSDFVTQTKIPLYLPAVNANPESYSDFLSGRPDFVEADVTVIKKSPLTAPTLNIAASKFGNNSAGDGIPGTGLSPVRTTYEDADQENFTFIPNVAFEPEDYESMPTYGDYVFNTSPVTGSANYYANTSLGANWDGTVTFNVNPAYGNDENGIPVWADDDILNMKSNYVDPLNNIYDYEIRLLISAINGNAVTGKIQSISTNILKFEDSNGVNIPLQWEIVLEEGVPMFEYIFPRFAYRWKYIDNEYSCYSPFTDVAFIGGKFEYVSSDGYNIGMTNNVRKLIIESLDWGTEEVVEIDLLFKQSNSPVVYTVDTLKRQDSTTQTPTGPVINNTFEIKTELIGAVVESNQLLRPWDNVPRLAKGQEITGNRILYANYLQNYNVGTVNLDVSLTRKNHKSLQQSIVDEYGWPNQFTGLPEPSLKSIRTYQAGIVYKDAYGRETPVFTSVNGSFDLNVIDSDAVNKISVQPVSSPPDWATHYKFFIKEMSNEYYNLAMDRFYPAEDGNVWLSFPSSERNKVSEETYLILKKQHDTSIAVDDLTRYKIIAIDNEVPEFVAEFQKTNFGGTVEIKNEIEPGFLTLKLAGPNYSVNPLFQTNLSSDNSIRIIKGGNKTEDYQIERSAILGDAAANPATYTITLKRPLGGDVSFLEGLPINTEVEIVLFSTEFKNKAEFEGRFFAKINRDFQFDKNIISPFRALEPRYAIVDDIDFTYDNDPFIGDGNGGTGYHWGDRGWNKADTILPPFDDCSGEADRNRTLGQGSWGGVGGNIENPAVKDNYSPPQAGNFWFGYTYINTQFGSRLDDFTGTAFRGAGGFDGLATSGAQIRFVNNNTGEYSNVYTINQTSSYGSRRGRIEANATDGCFVSTDANNIKYTVAIELKEQIQDNLDWIPNGPGQWYKLNNALISIQIVTEEYDGDNKLLTSSNPAVFETEPKEAIDLDLYYEASDALPIANHANAVELNWYNCYSYGNGVESNRIRDDYNAVYIDKGPKVSTVLDEPYASERRGSGLIFSQIYNSTSGINRLNQFIQALPITKDLNPIYGTIQKLHTRDTDLISLCEDKCLRILANKDALYNADGNVNLTGNTAVLGQAMPYAGEFGISKNPESFSSYGFRAYFTDKNRGAVIRLSRDGITNIADKGMSGFFADNLRSSSTAIGSYDDDKDIYNLTLNKLSNYWQLKLSPDASYQLNPDCDATTTQVTSNATVSFKESVDGWTSRKDFIQEGGITLNNIYYTFKNGLAWVHGGDAFYNNFYGVQYDSSFNVLINEQPEVVKGFKTLNYTGTRTKLFEYESNGKWYSIAEVNANGIMPTAINQKQAGWYVNYVKTDLEGGEVKEFAKKEGKYFNYIKALTIFNDCEVTPDGIGEVTEEESGPQDYILTVTIDEECSTGSNTPTAPDSTIMLLENQRTCDVANSGFSYVDQATALAAKCGMDAFFTDTVQGDYSLAQCAAIPNFKYFSNAGIVVGTQLYDPETNSAIGPSWQGFYLYRGSLTSPSDIVSWYLDPLNTTYVIPNDWYILEISSSGTIASLTQYNTLGPCLSEPLVGGAIIGLVCNMPGATACQPDLTFNDSSDSSDLLCDIRNWVAAWSSPSIPSADKRMGYRTDGLYWYTNTFFEVGDTLNKSQSTYNNKLFIYYQSPSADYQPVAFSYFAGTLWTDLSAVPDEYYVVATNASGEVIQKTKINTLAITCP